MNATAHSRNDTLINKCNILKMIGCINETMEKHAAIAKYHEIDCAHLE
jgi:hypothetical protein